MKLVNIKVIPNAKKNEVKQEGEHLKVYVSVPAVNGKANKAAIKLLSEFFKTKKNTINIVKGEISREKTISFDAYNQND